MKKLFTILLSISVIMLFLTSCNKGVKTEPVKVDKGTEKVVEKQPKIEKPQLSEEEIFQRKSLEQLNKEGDLNSIQFDFDKYTIKDEMKTVLQKNADWLINHKTVILTIEGHCDERGTVEYNMALGEKRAKAALDYLASLGVDIKSFRVLSYGKSRPFVDEHNEEAWLKNRRADFVITAK
jgi:peptidoglycan-associated lipoprotein